MRQTGRAIQPRVTALVVLAVTAIVCLLYGYSTYLSIRYETVVRTSGWKAAERGGEWKVAEVADGGRAAGKLKPGDTIASVDGDARAAALDPELILALKRSSEPYSLAVERGGQRLSFTLRFEVRRDYRNLAWMATLLIAGLSFAVVGCLMGFFKPDEPVARIGSIFCITCAVHMLGVGLEPARSEFEGANAWFFACVYSVSYFPYALGYHFASYFPAPTPESTGSRRFRSLLYALCLVLFLPDTALTMIQTCGPATAIPFYVASRGWLPAYFAASQALEGFYGLLATVASGFVLFRHYRATSSPDQLRRIRWVVYGGAACVVPQTIYEFLLMLFNATGHHALTQTDTWYTCLQATNLGVIAIPLTLGYAVIKHRLLNIDFVFRRGLQYLFAKNTLSIILMLPMIVFALRFLANPGMSLGQAIFEKSVGFYLCTSVAAGASLRYRKPLMSKLDRIFFRESHGREQAVINLIASVGAAGSVEEMARQVTSTLHVGAGIESVTMLYRERADGEFHSVASSDSGVATSDALRLIRGLPERAAAVATETIKTGAPAIEDGGASMVLPMLGSDSVLAGALLLGQKRTEEPYTKTDRALLAALTTQCAAVSERLWMRRGSLAPVAIGERRTDALMKECRICGRCFGSGETVCPSDGAELIHTLPMGLVLEDKYRLKRRIGVGGNGAVYEAADLRLSRDVAVKVILGSAFGDPRALRRFEREAQTSARLSHPNIVTIHDYGWIRAEGAFIVMELLEGNTLRAELNRRLNISAVRAARWMDDILAALESAHGADIVHRDLKPENLFVVRRRPAPERVKVLDFGIAKIHEVLETQTFTHAGEAIGTLGYMSPEQLIGAVVDARSDLFSIGVVVFELLSGKRPFTGRSTAEALASIRLGTPELPGTQTREIYRILAKSMAWDPADRYQTAGALRSELIPALQISSINVNEAASGLSTRIIRQKAAAVRSD